MSSTNTSHRIIRRILVALDTSPHSMAALESAVQLAVDLEAELQGLYIEDADLLHAVDLPFVQEVRKSTFKIGGISSVSLQRQFRIQADRARQALESIAGRSNVRHSFRVVRGQVAAELLSAAAKADLLLLGKASTRFSSRRKLGRTARTILQELRSPTLILHDTLQLDGNVLLVYDASKSADRMLHIGVQLASRRHEDHLSILLEAATEEEAIRLKDRIADVLQPSVPHISVYATEYLDASTIALMGQEINAGVIMVPATHPLFQGQPLQAFLHEVDRPVLLVDG